MFTILLLAIYLLVCGLSVFFGMRVYKCGLNDGMEYERNGKIPAINIKKNKEIKAQEEINKEFEELMAYDAN